MFLLNVPYSPPLVHPHVGESSGLQRPGSGLLRLPADGGAARKAGVLYGHHEDAAAGADGRARAEQKPQTHAQEVRKGRMRPQTQPRLCVKDNDRIRGQLKHLSPEKSRKNTILLLTHIFI